MHQYRSTITVAKSNASMREWNGRYRDDHRGGLPGCSAEKGRRVFVVVVDLSGINNGLDVYGEEEGEQTVNIKQTEVPLSMK